MTYFKLEMEGIEGVCNCGDGNPTCSGGLGLGLFYTIILFMHAHIFTLAHKRTHYSAGRHQIRSNSSRFAATLCTRWLYMQSLDYNHHQLLLLRFQFDVTPMDF